MARRRQRGFTPGSAVGAFLPMAIATPIAGATIGIGAAGAAAATAAGQPGVGALLGVANMGVATRLIGTSFGGGKRKRML